MEPVSRIDVNEGALYLRGISIKELAPRHTYEEILHLLIHGSLGSSEEASSLSDSLVSKRALLRAVMAGYPQSSESGDLLYNYVGYVKSGESLEESLLGYVACAPLAAAVGYRLANGLEVVQQRQDLNLSENLLWMLTGTEPTERDARDFTTCLNLHMDDPDNPSLSRLLQGLSESQPIDKVIEGALEAHRGPLHHGAGSLAADMVLNLKQAQDLHTAMTEILETGNPFYGLGHRVYRTLDPRAKVLRAILVSRTKDTDLSWLPGHVEAVAKTGAEILLDRKGVQVYPNVDLYNALVYSTFGLPIELNTDLFAVSRMAGWMAHALEFLGP
jgi:citrate synthase